MKHRIIMSLTLAGLAWPAPACRTRGEAPSAVAESEAAPAPNADESRQPLAVFLLAGGFRSCHGGGQGPESAVSRHLEGFLAHGPSHGWRMAAVVACFDASPADGVTFAVRKHGGEHPLPEYAYHQRRPLAELYAAVNALAAKAGPGGAPAPLFLLGHSYGGWLAQMTAQNLAAGIKARAMFLLDPLDPVACPDKAVLARVGTLFGSGEKDAATEACTRSPVDAMPSPARLAESVGTTTVFFQDQFASVHGSAVPGARNVRCAYDASVPWPKALGAQHWAVAEDATIWAQVRRDMAAALGWPADDAVYVAFDNADNTKLAAPTRVTGRCENAP